MGNNNLIDVVVLNYNDSETTVTFVSKMKINSNIRKIIIIDNCSTDGSLQKLRKLKDDKIDLVECPKNGGYGYGNNYGVRYAAKKYNSKYVLICNPDTYISEEGLSSIKKVLDDHEEYAFSTCIMSTNGIMANNTAWKIPNLWEQIGHNLIWPEKIFNLGYKYVPVFYENDTLEDTIEVECVQGSLLLLRVSDFVNIGGYDEDVFLYNEENILGSKYKSSHKKGILCLRYCYDHLHSVSINKSYSSFFAKWKLDYDSQIKFVRRYITNNMLSLIALKTSMIIRLITIIVRNKLQK